MNRENFYDVLIQIFNLNVDFSIIFDRVEEPFKSEILNCIIYIKSNPPKEDLMKKPVSDRSKKIIVQYIDYILKKVKS